MTRETLSGRDPRDIITERNFLVEPALLGRPLARPWRRGAAMLVDGAAIAVLSNAPGIVFGVAVAFVLWRLSAGEAAGGIVRRTGRRLSRAAAAVVVFFTAAALWSAVGERRAGDRSGASAGIDEARVTVTGIAGVRAAADAMSLTRARDAEEAAARAGQIVTQLRSAGMRDGEIEDVLQELATLSPSRPWVGEAVAAIPLAPQPAEPFGDRSGPPSPEAELVVTYARALEAARVEEASATRGALIALLAADTIADLHAALEREASRADRLQIDLREADRRAGFLDAFRAIRRDLGLGFGWTGLYFTAFLALWGGQTPGKRLLHIRVVRLDAKPLGWWAAFERFAGYAAGLATGLLGFIQIFWDSNRQAIQDKISKTVVVRE